MNRARIVIGFLAHVLMISAAPPISGPVLGHVARDGAVRPILGIPGSAYFGPPVETAGRTVAVTSAAAYAITVDEDGTTLRLQPLTTNVVARVLESSQSSPVETVVLSPLGSAAVVLRQDGTVEVFAGLPTNPALRDSFSVARPARLAAVDENGAFAAIVNDQQITVAGGGGQRLINGTDIRSIAFRTGGELLYLNGNHLLTDSGASNSTLADNLSDAAAALPAERGTIFVLDGGGRQLLMTGREDGSSQRIDLPCSVNTVDYLSRSVLRLPCKVGGQVHLLDLSDQSQRVFFVPEPVQ